MELYLLRHADAGDPDAWHGPDAERPLSGKGQKQAERLGTFLADMGFGVEVVISSPKVRAARTAEVVAEHIGAKVNGDERLGGEVSLSTLQAVLRNHGESRRVMVVGHDPDFSELVSVLCGAANVPMKKGALARIDVPGSLEPGGGTLRWLVPPDLLKPER